MYMLHICPHRNSQQNIGTFHIQPWEHGETWWNCLLFTIMFHWKYPLVL